MKYSKICQLSLTLVGLTLLLFGCTSAPPPVPDPPVVVESPEPVVETVPEPVQPDEFVVTEEIYKQTFEDVKAFILNLNAIIKAEDFASWKSYLTSEYADYYSDTQVLKGISDELKKKYRYDLRLRTLKDYFTYIVVGSRQEAELNEIEFIDENHILAYSIVNDTPAILYYLAFEDEGWKIARWQG